jgi:signal peptide peptidase SppA
MWAITPQMLETIDGIISARMAGGQIDLAAVEAELGRPLDNTRAEKPYTVVDGVAVVSLSGVMGKRMNMFSKISGGMSTEIVRGDIQAAIDDPDVAAIVLSIDSPGGTVDGTAELADFVLRARSEKPVYAYADGTMASAAYWVGAAAEKIYGVRTANIGSVSVVVCHYDRSRADDAAGIKRTFVTSGKYKRIANDAEPLSGDGRDYLQEIVDRTHALFIEGIAAGRGMTPEAVDAAMGDGRIFLAAQALELNMIDAIGSLADTINAARAAAKEANMNKVELQEKYPEAAAALIEDGRAMAAAELTAAAGDQATAALAAEGDRIFGLYARLHGPEAEASFRKLVDSGLTTAQIDALGECGFTKAAAGASADADERLKILAGLEQTGQHEVTGGGAGGSAPTDFMAAVDAHIAESGGKVSKAEAVKAVSKMYPALHEEYLTKANQR